MATKTTVYLKSYTSAGCPEVRAPKPGEYFIAEDSGKVVKRKSATAPRMLRQIVSQKSVNAKFQLREGTVLEKAGLKRKPYTNEFFLSPAERGGFNIGKQGVASWKSNSERDILRVATA
jgi:hypothetical protein